MIVGGTAGVGLAAARKFIEAGVRRIAIVGRNAERGEAAAASLRELPGGAQVLFIAADANRAGEAQRIVAGTVDRFGTIDILLNSTVGTAGPQLLKDIPANELEAILVQQAMGPILMSHAVLPTMIDGGRGVILNIASDAAKLATPGESVIGAAMAAIVMFTRTLAIEAKRNNIRANALTPSLIQGTLTHARMQENEFSQKLFAKAAKMAHLGVAEADDLADLAVFLASPQAAKITGQAISANGGISAA
ncbi:2-hydroxycyclohexane-1-carbonyl-CoA dehydrogenase [Novosphingobium colocasiae]|uniref:2-hydroxycyclohexane-1-carbonyl-CoA dehydrogenase n=1 Tax=Novosphingobium colocasiae TaxID=1256513 RepID=A0A918PKY2_9SPHN|nr:2-hydroxycyclohexane-1-carbonyl-CoA dehydrogenase [Novosphingobium colocasiae]